MHCTQLCELTSERLASQVHPVDLNLSELVQKKFEFSAIHSGVRAHFEWLQSWVKNNAFSMDGDPLRFIVEHWERDDDGDEETKLAYAVDREYSQKLQIQTTITKGLGAKRVKSNLWINFINVGISSPMQTF